VGVRYPTMRSKIVPLETFVVFNEDGTEFGRLYPETAQLFFAEAQARGLTPDALFLAMIDAGLPPAAEKDHLAEIVSFPAKPPTKGHNES